MSGLCGWLVWGGGGGGAPFRDVYRHPVGCPAFVFVAADISAPASLARKQIQTGK